ncbi:MAG TPA: GNAT family N-acetyltransferase [Ignavibacteria bacterium]
MNLEVLHDKAVILNFLKKNSGLQIYSIGDLDDFFWPKTTWFALMDGNFIQSIALLYVGMDTPTLLSFYDKELQFTYGLLERIRHILPMKFNAHLSPDLIEVFGRQNIIEYYGFNYKMVLKRAVSEPNDKNIRKLKVNDLSIIKDFYAFSYPGNWFDSRMLETNKYYGYFINEKLVGVSGIHVFSEDYKVAALGNIATHPDYRGQQIGYKLTSALCYDLQSCVDLIGLNVNSDNYYAIKCYKKIGFELIGTYDECLIKNDCIIF